MQFIYYQLKKRVSSLPLKGPQTPTMSKAQYNELEDELVMKMWWNFTSTTNMCKQDTQQSGSAFSWLACAHLQPWIKFISSVQISKSVYPSPLILLRIEAQGSMTQIIPLNLLLYAFFLSKREIWSEFSGITITESVHGFSQWGADVEVCSTSCTPPSRSFSWLREDLWGMITQNHGDQSAYN